MFIKDDKLKEGLPVSLQRLEQDQSRANTASEQQKIFTGVQQSTLMAIVVNSTRSGFWQLWTWSFPHHPDLLLSNPATPDALSTPRSKILKTLKRLNMKREKIWKSDETAVAPRGSCSIKSRSRMHLLKVNFEHS